MFQKTLGLFIMAVLFVWNIKDGLELSSLLKKNESKVAFLETAHSKEVFSDLYAPIEELITSEYFYHNRFDKYLELDPENYELNQIEKDLPKYFFEQHNLEHLNLHTCTLSPSNDRRLELIRKKMLYKLLLNYSTRTIVPYNSSLDRNLVYEDRDGFIYLVSNNENRKISKINGVKTTETEYDLPYSDTLVMQSTILTINTKGKGKKILDSLTVVDTFITSHLMASEQYPN